MKSILGLFLCSSLSLFAKPMPSSTFYISTNDGEVSQPIALCELDLETGEVEVLESFDGVKSPSYLSLNSAGDRLYSVCENRDGEISAWSIDPADHSLTKLGSCASGGIHPCHLSISLNGQTAFVANYSSGTVGVVGLDSDGDVFKLMQTLQNEGKGPNSARQEGPHMHFVHPTLDGEMVMAVDLGTDRVMLYQLDETTGQLLANSPQPYLKIEPGSGPRHLAFHGNGKWIYLLNELNGTVDTLIYDKVKKTLSFHSRIGLMPDGFDGNNKSAAIRVHPTGKFVYGSNRGDLDSISVFKVKEDGSLESVGILSESISWPRDFAIDPSGKFLLAACREDDAVRVFRIDPGTGLFSDTGNSLSFEKPVCILF